MSGDDERYMRKALELAGRAVYTNGNPRVGAVIVREGGVIGEGYHEGWGRPHAETVALEGIDARGTTVYVTLEPCNHHAGTPPCAPSLVDAGVARVVAAMEDPDERVKGRGVAYLRSRGVAVDVGVLEDEARELNAAFVRHRTSGRPLVRLKLALTLDGRLAAADGTSRWITGEEARRRVHEARARADAVLVGAGTVLADDPALTAREVVASRQPHRVLVDSSGRLPPDANAFRQEGNVVVATTEACPHERQVEWKETGAEVVVLPASPEGVDLDVLIENLGARGWLEVLCEGGAQLATSLLRRDLVDRLELHFGAVMVGSGPGIGELDVTTMRDARRWQVLAVEKEDNDVLVSLRRST